MLRGGSSKRRRGRRDKAFPKYCRCGAEAVIKTSGTVKNSGRLFHCCPYGSEEPSVFLLTSMEAGVSFDCAEKKSHLFTWTDECMVEEIEDLKDFVSDVKGEISILRGEIDGLEKELERSKLKIQSEIKGNGCCVLM
ncbi:unnamed protein product [Eruca vesicaria subsp. sativa]|uniref:GRF-type domain-containing protein n=1 Tax=Eruca vesicaria subsp. sativa TaxID=29727 RepID=A0ABC8L6F7_ERUVS|nr:unnamed protein product [Eruca vesicaria subsp. sativa]